MRLRPVILSDLEELVALSGQIDPDRPESPVPWQKVASGELDHPSLVVLSPAGRLIGYGCARPEPGYPPEDGVWRLTLGVAPAWRRQGIGDRLYAQILDELRSRGVKRLRARAVADDRASLSFLEARGLRTYQRMLHLTQELTALPAPSMAPVERVRAAGIELLTLPEAQATDPEALRGIYQLYGAAAADIPTDLHAPPPPYEAYVKTLSDPLLLPDCFFLARAGGRYIGTSYAARLPNRPEALGHRFTGVLRECRRQGIALALKTLVTQYARTHGYRRVTTATLEQNRGMRAVNEQLGFTTTYVQLRLERAL
ncbi:MAG: GNAT family N-acetyltransferase [Bacillota bacterium]